MPIPKSKRPNTIVDEAVRLCKYGFWVVPQSGKSAIVLGWPELRLSE